MSVVTVLDTVAQQVGLRLISSWRLKDWHFGQHTARVLRQYDIDVILDVGANRGQYRDFLRNEVGYEGWICSFEPQSSLVAQMQQRAGGDARWQVTRAALGREPGTLPLRITAQDMFSSLLPARTDAVAKMTAYNTTARTEDVPVMPLRSIWPSLRQAHSVSRGFLKIDTQGFDLEVLAGAGDALADILLIQSELSVQPLYEGAPSYLETIRVLGDLGYELSGMHPVSWDGARLVEFDGLFARRRAL
jgi:FkbM family methyltransferase